MKKAAVLCPGPSVARTWRGRDGYDVVAGVNRAVHRAPCDWWVFLDETPPMQLPMKLFTTEQVRSNLAGLGRIGPGIQVEEVERKFGEVPHELGGASWCTFSSTAALVRMFLDGARSIDVYGYDATGAPDFDGVSLPTNNRDAERWEHEAACWRVVLNWLESQGCTVTRIQP